MGTEHTHADSDTKTTRSSERLTSEDARWTHRSCLSTALLLLCVMLLGGQDPWANGAPQPLPSDPVRTEEVLWAGRSKAGRKATAPATSQGGEAQKKSTTQGDKKTGGESEATKRGRQAHADWQPGEGYEKEVRLPSGHRADAVNFEKQDVKELKPNNSRAIKRGEKQVEKYRSELEEKEGGQWTGKVETYEAGEKK